MLEYTPTNCHPLHSVCLLLNAVQFHLNRREFMSPALTKMLLPDNTRIIYKSAASDKTREDALPIVAYKVGGLSLVPFFGEYSLGGEDGNTTAEMNGEISFAVSTTNEALTSELALEIGTYCMSIYKELRNYDLVLNKVLIGEVQRGQAGYFDAQVQLAVYLGKPTWNSSDNAGILREIGLKIAFN